jgi:glutamate:GABA antiporter
MAEAGAVSAPLQTAAAAREKTKLRKVLGRVDLVLFTACAILGFDTVAASAQAGAQAVTWLLISLVIFLIPYGMLTAELGSAFPVEGGPYEWARLAFGRCAGSVTAILYWLSNPTWIGGTLTASTIAAINGLVLHKPLGMTAEIIIGLVSRPFFEWVTLGAFGGMVLLGIVFWAVGARNVRRGLLTAAGAASLDTQ